MNKSFAEKQAAHHLIKLNAAKEMCDDGAIKEHQREYDNYIEMIKQGKANE